MVIFSQKVKEAIVLSSQLKRNLLCVIFLFFGIIIFQQNVFSEKAKAPEPINITFGPGHGGIHPGCVKKISKNEIVTEQKINYKIATYLKQELEKYKTENGEKVNIFITRNENCCPYIEQRIKFAKNKNSNALISLHINASNGKSSGCMAIATISQCNNLYKTEEDLSKSILKELNAIGLKNWHGNGIYRRKSSVGEKYPDNTDADWYGIIRNGVLEKIPSIIVEHAYIDNKNDYDNFLSSDEKIKKLAIADMKGIVNFFKLKKQNAQNN